MATTYERAGESITGVVDLMMQKYHHDLQSLEVKVDVLMARNAEGDAVTLGGYPCQAKVRVIGLKDRAAGRGDAEIIIDELNWDGLTSKQRDALIDHELEHLEPVINPKNNKPKRDDLDRPKLKIKKHDWQIGWFDSIAKRHGDHSAEKQQAFALQAESGQLYFDFESKLRQSA